MRSRWAIRQAAAFMAAAFVVTLVGAAQSQQPDSAFPELSRRIPLFKEQLTSGHHRVRYALLGELDGQDDETRRALELLIGDANKAVANQAQVRWLQKFIEVDRSLFRPEVYLPWPRGTPEIPKDKWRQVMLDHVLGRAIHEDLCGTDAIRGLASLDESVMDSVEDVGKEAARAIYEAEMANPVTVVGMLGTAEDAKTIKPFGDSQNPYLAWKTAVALVRLGDRESADAILMRVATGERDDGKLYYVIKALDTMRRLKNPAFGETVVKVWEDTTDEAKKLADGRMPQWWSDLTVLAARAKPEILR